MQSRLNRNKSFFFSQYIIMKGNPLEGGVESGMFSANNLCKYFYSIKKEIPSLCRYWIGRSEQRGQLMTQTKAEELRREIYGNRTY